MPAQTSYRRWPADCTSDRKQKRKMREWTNERRETRKRLPPKNAGVTRRTVEGCRRRGCEKGRFSGGRVVFADDDDDDDTTTAASLYVWVVYAYIRLNLCAVRYDIRIGIRISRFRNRTSVKR